MIPFKAIDYARTFVTGCLNKRCQGVIAFGVGDAKQGFKHGQITGIDIEGQLDRLNETFQYMLDNVIHSMEGRKCPLSVIEQRCFSLHFVRVVDRMAQPLQQSLHVVEIQVVPKWNSLRDNVYVSGKFTLKKSSTKAVSGDVPDDWKFRDCYKLDVEDPQVYVRETARTRKVDKGYEIGTFCWQMKQEYQGHVQHRTKRLGTKVLHECAVCMLYYLLNRFSLANASVVLKKLACCIL